MQFFEDNKLLTIAVILFVAILAVLVANIIALIYNGKKVITPNISSEVTIIGEGKNLNYLILGDSTAIAQGSDYDDGFAVKTAEFLAKNYTVNYSNFGVSGAKINEVANEQLENSTEFIPDVVLVAVGANDVTHLTSVENIKFDMKLIINKLRKRNNEVKIVFTGAASMGSVDRFIQPLKWIMDQQTKHVNKMMKSVARDNEVSFAYIARETGERFAKNPKLFAQDKFHPNSDGYAVWVETLIPVIEKALSN